MRGYNLFILTKSVLYKFKTYKAVLMVGVNVQNNKRGWKFYHHPTTSYQQILTYKLFSLKQKVYKLCMEEKKVCKLRTHTSTEDFFDPLRKLFSTLLFFEVGVKIFTFSNLLEWFTIYRVKSSSVLMFWIPLNSNVIRLVERHVGVTDGSTHLEFPTSFLSELISVFLCMKTKNYR